MHGLKLIFTISKGSTKFETSNKDWKTIFEIINKYHASFEFQKQKKFKCIFEIQVRMSQNKITLYNYRDAIPRSSTISEELGSRFKKGKESVP